MCVETLYDEVHDESSNLATLRSEEQIKSWRSEPGCEKPVYTMLV